MKYLLQAFSLSRTSSVLFLLIFLSSSLSSSLVSAYEYYDLDIGWLINDQNARFLQSLSVAGNISTSGAINATGQMTASQFNGPLNGNATTATTASAAPWTGITGKPTNLSQFTNDTNLVGGLGAQDVGAINVRVPSGFYQNSTPLTGSGWPVSGSWYHLLADTHSNGGNYYSMQLAADFFSNSLYYRSTNDNGNTAWSKVLLSDNFNSYAPTLAGVGATGIWPIAISGNAATATNSTQLGGVAASSYALLNSPALTGDPTAPNPLTADNDTSIATTAFVKSQAYITTETDPKIGNLTTNYTPKWNGTTLANSLIYSTSTGVGISTENPSATLAVSGSVIANVLYLGTAGSTLPVGGDTNYTWGFVGNNITNSNTGNVGIGTTTPTEALTVSGNIIANTPTAGNHVATKAYVDAQVSAAGSSAGFTVNDLDNDKFLAYYSGASQAGSPAGYDCLDNTGAIGATMDGGLCDGDADGQTNYTSVLGKNILSIPSSMKSLVDCNDSSAAESDNCVIKDTALTLPNGDYYLLSTRQVPYYSYARFTLYNKSGKQLRFTEFPISYSSANSYYYTAEQNIYYVMNANGDLGIMSTNINVNQGGQSTTFSILRVNGKLDTGVNNIPVQLGYSKVTLGTDGQTFCAAIWHTGSSTMYSSINSINQTPFTYVQNAWEQTMTCDANNFYFSFTYTSDGINFYLYIYKNSNAFIYNGIYNNYNVSNMKILDGGNLYTQGHSGLTKYNGTNGALIWNVPLPTYNQDLVFGYDGINVTGLDVINKRLYTINQSNGTGTYVTYPNLGNPCSLNSSKTNLINGNYVDSTSNCIFMGY